MAIRSLAISVLFSFFSVSTLAALLDFETGDFSGWDVTRLVGDHSGQIVNTLSSNGTFSARIELRENDFTHNGYRAEIKDHFHAPVGSEIFYSFSTYIPEGAPLTADNRCVFAQLHDQDMAIGKPSFVHSPPLSLALVENKMTIKLCNSDATGNCEKTSLYEKSNFAFGKWHDFIFKIRWSDQENGSIHAWMDGEKIISYSGRVGNPVYQNPFDNLGAYMKLGIYCAQGPKIPLVLYHDNYFRSEIL